MNTLPERKLSIVYGDEVLDFEVLESPSRTEKILIKVYADCRVVVSTPLNTDEKIIIEAVKQRSRWIYKQLRGFREQSRFITPRQYKSGESHFYLGKQYQLKVIHDDTKPRGVKLLRGRLEVNTLDVDIESIKSHLNEWYRSRAKVIFEARLQHILEQALWVEDQPSIRLMTMRTQWGNCSPSGVLTLNPHLVKAPTICIDYVILHELCHLVEHNHSERFYQLLNQVMPDWAKIKNQLDIMANKLIN
ncbi:M48 family metallopeptidase [Acinetobacter baumannii]|uniref:M48 family metallopeptidase n=1 Tax=Acinetobacter calcoaceticus/baumannii complex TaxID=909768 RepID=UPI0011DE28F2|nr:MULTISPECIES: SprT family zinc-dependent metalloprotease [Acinetobacter calcoaceticus/baumannii complex]MBR7688878.1 M48 family metallopeptidase [Acinetobacter nosocomialis]MCG9290588.1 M48 family metallopeptidase [Acinetobacter nosocomialis]MDI9662776.1 SprT family zinc-dependent metalloprotease [Acinetobacter baumannii]MDI9709059.1 SprT family zinc-dependent metalloprotease [Acinetobacter baumannii]MDQ8906124.1 SprT family zinc-dependent metalloprotease [Acinetobacter nosocomialis]